MKRHTVRRSPKEASPFGFCEYHGTVLSNWDKFNGHKFCETCREVGRHLAPESVIPQPLSKRQAAKLRSKRQLEASVVHSCPISPLSQEFKICSYCKVSKPINTFTQKRGGLFDKCRKCRKLINLAERRASKPSRKLRRSVEMKRRADANNIQPNSYTKAGKLRRKWKPGKQYDRSGSGGNYSERKINLKQLGFDRYPDYLKSVMWREVRRKAYALHGKECQLCGGKAREIHHNWYGIADLKGERLCNLHPLCENCHHIIEHDKDGEKHRRFHLVREAFDKLRMEMYVSSSNYFTSNPASGTLIDSPKGV